MVLYTWLFDKMKSFAVLVRKKNKPFFLIVPDFLGGGVLSRRYSSCHELESLLFGIRVYI